MREWNNKKVFTTILVVVDSTALLMGVLRDQKGSIWAKIGIFLRIWRIVSHKFTLKPE